MRKLFRLALKKRSNRILLGCTLITMLLLTVASQLEMFSLGVITNKGSDKSDFIGRAIHALDDIFPLHDNVRNIAILLITVALFKAIMMFFHRYVTKIIAIRMSCDLRQDFFEHIQSLPMGFYQQHNIGALSSRVVGDAALIADAVNSCLVNYLQTPFVALSTLILCFLTSWQLSLMIFFGIPLIAGPIIILAKHVKRISRLIQQNQERFASALIDFLSGIQTVKVFAMEAFSLQKYRAHNDQMAALEKKSAFYDTASRPIVHTLAMLFLAAALLYGLYGLDMTISEVFFYVGMLYLFYEPIKKFAEENSHIQRGIAAAERLTEVISIKPNIQDSPEASSLKSFERAIEFDNVWFRYGTEWALKGVSFSIQKGETVAIVGPTGSGKSTLVQLLPRLYDLQQGEIRIDGKAITAYTQKSLRENIACVLQKPFLFLDTIAQNISFGRPFSDQEIQTAARNAHAEEFILQLPETYQTQLAESGKNLSGGQQQRLAIARALVKKAPILIMDEATSALDNISEFYIKNALRKFRGEMTQIIIAHRLSTIEDADRIIYMDRGQKIAEGTKDELLQICPGFRHMWELHQEQQSS